MAATGYTPISLYYSTTASAVPTAGNLANGELALNIADMKLYAKNSAGTVTLLASNSSTGATVSSVSGTGTVSGITLSGTVTSSGSLTLGGSLSLVSPPAIGSTTPNTGAFTTLSATGQITGRSSNGAVFVTSNGSDADFVLSLASGLVTQNVTGSLQLQTGSVNRAVISSTGLAVTGTASSTNYGTFRGLRIGVDGANDIYSSASANIYYSASGASYGHVIGNASAHTYAQFQYTAQIFYSSNVERARVQTGFSVGTTADPGAGAIYATGNITAYYSDERLKDVKGRITNALDKVRRLSGVYYTNNETAKALGYTSDEMQVGVLANQMKGELPEIVKPAPFDLDENGNSKSGQNYMTVQYERGLPLIIEAIKELADTVDALAAR